VNAQAADLLGLSVRHYLTELLAEHEGVRP
jgi:hypothetical protein